MVRKIITTSHNLFSRQSTNILSAATVITGASLLSSMMGLFRNRLLIARFFETPLLREQLDAYWVAFRIPEFVFQLLIMGALSAAFIPIYSKYQEKNNLAANEMANTMVSLVVGVFMILSVIIFIFAKPLIVLITSTNFSPDQILLATSITRVMIFAQLFFALSNFMTGIIQANHFFLLPALSPLAYNLGIIIGTVFLTPFMGIYGPALGVVIGAFLHLLIQWPLAHKLGLRIKLTFSFKHPGVHEMTQLMIPRAMAISVDQFELLASVFFATILPAGNLTILNLASQLMSAPLRILSVPIGQASLPFLSQEATTNLAKFKLTLTHTLNQVLFLTIPASIILLVLRIPLVRLAYGATGFPWSATLTTGRLVAVLTTAIFAYGIQHVVIRGFYALKNSHTPLYLALATVILCISLMSFFVWQLKWGVIGIGLALTLTNLIESFFLLFIMIKKYDCIDKRQILTSQLKIVLAATIMGVALWAPMRFLDQWVFDTTRTLSLILLTITVSIIGGSVYLGLARLLHIEELGAYKGLFAKISKWRQVLSASNEVIDTTSQTDEIKP